jgi:hypothetical protein
MRTIYKYELKGTSGRYTFLLPSDAEIILVKAQRNVPCIWVKLDTENAVVTREFRLYGTGHRIEEKNLYHHGSFFMQDGTFVFHLFEVMV